MKKIYLLIAALLGGISYSLADGLIIFSEKYYNNDGNLIDGCSWNNPVVYIYGGSNYGPWNAPMFSLSGNNRLYIRDYGGTPGNVIFKKDADTWDGQVGDGDMLKIDNSGNQIQLYYPLSSDRSKENSDKKGSDAGKIYLSGDFNGNGSWTDDSKIDKTKFVRSDNNSVTYTSSQFTVTGDKTPEFGLKFTDSDNRTLFWMASNSTLSKTSTSANISPISNVNCSISLAKNTQYHLEIQFPKGGGNVVVNLCIDQEPTIEAAELSIKRTANENKFTENGKTLTKHSYYTFQIDPNGEFAGADIYYTLNGTDATINSKAYHSGDVIAVAPGATINAVAYRNGSPVAIGTLEPVSNFELENQTPSSDNLLHDFNVILNMTQFEYKTAVRPKMEASVVAADKDMDESNYVFSWAKFSDYDYYDQAKSDQASNDNVTEDYIDSIVDHLETPSMTQEVFGPDIQNNDGDYHVCRNLTKSYYRVYVHANTTPNADTTTYNTLSANRPVVVLANEDSQSSGTSGPTNISTHSEARIAYTLVSDPESDLGGGVVTGVEDVVADEMADEDAPVVWYNLQGVRVENPANGIFIRVQGRKVSKELLK